MPDDYTVFVVLFYSSTYVLILYRIFDLSKLIHHLLFFIDAPFLIAPMLC